MLLLLLTSAVLLHSTRSEISSSSSPLSSNLLSSQLPSASQPSTSNHQISSLNSESAETRLSLVPSTISTEDKSKSITNNKNSAGSSLESETRGDERRSSQNDIIKGSENDVIKSTGIQELGTNVTLQESDDEDRDLKQSVLSGLDIRWGSDRGNHNLVLGKKQERDELLLRYVCKKDGRWLRTSTDEVMWPLYGRKPSNHIIHYVEALDQEVGGRGGFASITRGGVSHKNVTVSLKSQRNYGLNFIVSIWGSPEYHETYEDTIVINEKPDKYGVVQAYKPTPTVYLPPQQNNQVTIVKAPQKRPSQEYGIDPPAPNGYITAPNGYAPAPNAYAPAPNGYRPQLGWETDHHSNRPNYALSSQYGAPPPDHVSLQWGQEEEDTSSEEDVVESANPGVYVEQHQYKPTYNPYKPTGQFKPPQNLNAQTYLASKPKPNIYTHNVEAYKPGEYYVHHQQNYYAKPQKYT
uniref:Probable salivary secreted peptide n=1 Tax=Cacopsylla melanoneura TaxID=428564 RepID=A0A8D8VXZ3_9HEMI